MDKKDILKTKLLKKSIENNESQKYFSFFLKIEKLLKEEKYNWLSQNETFVEVNKKMPIYLDLNALNSFLNFFLWCFVVHLLIFPHLNIDFATIKYGPVVVFSGFILHAFMSLRFKRLSLIAFNIKFEKSEMSREFFDKLLNVIPDDRIQDKKDMMDILGKYSYDHNGVRQYMYLLVHKILNTK